ncbi:MAG: hypothetical protein ACREBU_04425 [Nitrososphaera sp.]
MNAAADNGNFEEFEYEIAPDRLPMTLEFSALAQDESSGGIISKVSLWLYEARTGNNVTNVTYAIELTTVSASGLNSTSPFLRDVFHTSTSTFDFALKQSDEGQTRIENAYPEQFLNAWVWNGPETDMLTITSSEIQRNETYTLSVSILGIDSVRNLLKPDDVPRVEFFLDASANTTSKVSIIPGTVLSYQDQTSEKDESLLSSTFSAEVEGFSFEIPFSWSKEDFVTVQSNDNGILEFQVWDSEPRGGKLTMKLPSALVYLKGQGDSYQTVLGSLNVSPSHRFQEWRITEKYSPSCETLILTMTYDVFPDYPGLAHLTNFLLLGGSNGYQRPMGETITPTLALAEGNFTLHSISNAAVCDFSLLKEEKTLHIDVEHLQHWKFAVPKGYLEVTIPHKLLGGNYTVFFDGNKTDDFRSNTGTNSTVITIEYPPGAHSIDIVGTTVIPEFGTFMTFGLAIAMLLLSYFASDPRMLLSKGARG